METLIIFLLLVVMFAILMGAIKIVREYERLVVLRLGKFQRIVGPGITFMIPVIESSRKIDLDQSIPGWQRFSNDRLNEKILENLDIAKRVGAQKRKVPERSWKIAPTTLLICAIFLFTVSFCLIVIEIAPLGIPFALIGAIFYYLRHKSLIFSQVPTLTRAEIVSKDKSHRYDNYGDPFVNYVYILGFLAIDQLGHQQAIRLEVDVSENIFNQHNEGDVVTILYAPADPRYAILKGEKFRFTMQKPWQE